MSLGNSQLSGIRSGIRSGPGRGLVAAQMLSAAGLGWPGGPRWRLRRPAAALALVGGAAGGALAVGGLRFLGREVTPFVEPLPQARLRTAGPFAFSRNPVYTGGLLVAGAVAVLRRRPEPLVAFAALAAVLHLKVNAEERYLQERFGAAYDEYAARTPRLLGFPRKAL
jgi:protein-S-isoprenylcysteine O-methyltransferase Ste14